MKQRTDKVQLELTYGQMLDLVLYLGRIEQLDPTEQMLYDILTDKVKRIMEHDLYTVYKTAHTEQEKEQARLKYIESRGIPKDFRW